MFLNSSRIGRLHLKKPQDGRSVNVVGTLANHAFDEGAAERMSPRSEAATRPKGAFPRDPLARGGFAPTCPADVSDDRSAPADLLALKPVIRKAGACPVSFIGAVLGGGPRSARSRHRGSDVQDEAGPINRYNP